MTQNTIYEDIKNDTKVDSIIPVDSLQENKWGGYLFVSDKRLLSLLNLNEEDERVRIVDTRIVYFPASCVAGKVSTQEVVKEEVVKEEVVVSPQKAVVRGELQLIHYLKSTPEEEVRHLRGTIYFVPSDPEEEIKMIARSLPYTQEYILLEDKKKEVDDILNEFVPIKALYSHEGTIMRLFNFDNEWHFSTHRKIDGRNSRWSGDSFGAILQRACPDLDTSVLNEDYCYVLLIRDTHTQLVCMDSPCQVSHISTYDADGVLVKPLNIVGVEATKVEVSEVVKKVEDIDPSKTCGILLQNKNGDFIKVLNESYYKARLILNNEFTPSVRYIQLRMESYGKHKLLDRLLPEPRGIPYKYIEYALQRLPEFLGHLWYKRDYCDNYLVFDKKCYETMRSVKFFETISSYTKKVRFVSLYRIKDLVVILAANIKNSRHIYSIIKLMQQEYIKYHEEQKEWSSLFEYLPEERGYTEISLPTVALSEVEEKSKEDEYEYPSLLKEV